MPTLQENVKSALDTGLANKLKGAIEVLENPQKVFDTEKKPQLIALQTRLSEWNTSFCNTYESGKSDVGYMCEAAGAGKTDIISYSALESYGQKAQKACESNPTLSAELESILVGFQSLKKDIQAIQKADEFIKVFEELLKSLYATALLPNATRNDLIVLATADFDIKESIRKLGTPEVTGLLDKEQVRVTLETAIEVQNKFSSYNIISLAQTSLQALGKAK